jgi:flagellar hook-length control protein FliK
MNAAIVTVRVAPVPQPSPPQADAPQAAIQSARDAADPSQSAGGARDFAHALGQASARQNRKEDSAKPASGRSGGGALPPSGSGVPPAAVAPVAAPTGAPSLPPLLPPANGAPVLPSTLDEAGDSCSDDSTTPVAGAAAGSSPVAGTSSADTSSVGTSSAGSVTPEDDTTQAAQGAVFGPAMTDLSSTASDAAPASSTPATAASATPPSSTAPPAASTAPPAAGTAPPAAGTAPPAAGTAAVSQSDAAPALAAAALTNSDSAPINKEAALANTPASASPAGSPLAGSALMNLALTEGSDATGTAASALQAATAAASATSPPAADAAAAATSPVTALSISLPSPNGGSASQTAGTAGIPSSSAVSLGSGVDAHGHGGAGDSGSDTGTGSGSLAGGDGTAALQQLSTSAAETSSDAAPVPTARVHADVDSSDFPQGVADQVSLAVDNGWSSAKLSVNPPQLGPIELQIAVQGAHAQVAMSTHSAVTREALESSVPKLRDMLNSQGFTQVSVDISQRSFQERSTPAQPYRFTPGGVRETTPVSSSSAPVARTALGMLDTYA